MSNTPFKPVLLAAAIAVSSFLSGCGSEKKADAPPKSGTLAHSWSSAGAAWKAGEFEKSIEYLSRVAASKTEYRDRARTWLIVASAGVADGYLELSNAYDEAAKANKGVSSDFKNQMRAVRAIANTAALQFAETVHEFLDKNPDPKFHFEFDFPSGDPAEPMQLTKVRKGLSMQPSDHEVLRKAMATRGVVRFASMIAGSPDDPAKAQAQLSSAPRDVVLTAVAKKLISVADLYCQKKLDLPKRGNALVTEAAEAAALLPQGKERKALEAKAKEELKRFKIAT